VPESLESPDFDYFLLADAIRFSAFTTHAIEAIERKANWQQITNCVRFN